MELKVPRLRIASHEKLRHELGIQVECGDQGEHSYSVWGINHCRKCNPKRCRNWGWGLDPPVLAEMSLAGGDRGRNDQGM